jgi:hypothetical protein
VPVERPHSVDLDHALTRELTNRKYHLHYFPDHSCLLELQFSLHIVILHGLSSINPHFLRL